MKGVTAWCYRWFNEGVSSSSSKAEARREQLRERRADRRLELLTAAIDVIRRVGPDATMEDMASAGGISKPILYRHFNDREGLVSAITELALVDLGRILDDKLGEARLTASRDGVRATIDAFFDYIERDPALFRFVIDQDVRLDNPATVAFSEEVAKHVAAAIREPLDEAGLDSRPADVWGRAIVGMVLHTSIWWITTRATSRADAVDWLADLIWSGIHGGRVPA